MNRENISYVKEQLTEALLRLMEKQKFEELTVSHIVIEAMVSRASFYRNFTDKEDILRQYLLRLIRQWGAEFERTGDPDWVKSLLGHYYQNRDIYLLLYSQKLSYLVLDTIKAERGPKPEQNNLSAYASAWFCGGLFGWIDEWIKRGMQEMPEEMVRLMADGNKGLA